jgi:hypothetical protein
VAEAQAAAGAFPGAIGHTTMAGDDPTMFWRYIVNVRSLGKNPIDSLAKLAKMDVGKQIMPYFSPALTLGYAGIDHMKQQYGFSNTAFNLLAALPLRTPPARFDSTLGIFFGRITSLVYSTETMAGGTRLWLARDTTTNDSLLLERKLQPSFAVINGNMLVVASTPALLRNAVTSMSNRGGASGDGGSYFSGVAKVDSFATNATQYLKSYLLRRDRYTPAEITSRIDPLRNAMALYDRMEWTFRDNGGLRSGTGRLVAKK